MTRQAPNTGSSRSPALEDRRAGWNGPALVVCAGRAGHRGAAGRVAVRMPGRGGEPAVAGIGLAPLSPVQLTSALLTALASLGLGLVLGPEAPLTALGLTAGLVAARALRRGLRAGSRVM